MRWLQIYGVHDSGAYQDIAPFVSSYTPFGDQCRLDKLWAYMLDIWYLNQMVTQKEKLSFGSHHKRLKQIK